LADRTHPAKASRERNASSVSSPRAARDAARIDAGAKLAISRNACCSPASTASFPTAA